MSNKGGEVRLTVRLPADKYKLAQRIADKEERSLNWVLINGIDHLAERLEEKRRALQVSEHEGETGKHE